jgi:hypothetical protein
MLIIDYFINVVIFQSNKHHTEHMASRAGTTFLHPSEKPYLKGGT